jgi:hypothetical protein
MAACEPSRPSASERSRMKPTASTERGDRRCRRTSPMQCSRQLRVQGANTTLLLPTTRYRDLRCWVRRGHVPTPACHESRSHSTCCQGHRGNADTIDASSLYEQAQIGHEHATSTRGQTRTPAPMETVGTIPRTAGAHGANPRRESDSNHTMGSFVLVGWTLGSSRPDALAGLA